MLELSAKCRARSSNYAKRLDPSARQLLAESADYLEGAALAIRDLKAALFGEAKP